MEQNKERAVLRRWVDTRETAQADADQGGGDPDRETKREGDVDQEGKG